MALHPRRTNRNGLLTATVVLVALPWLCASCASGGSGDDGAGAYGTSPDAGGAGVDAALPDATMDSSLPDTWSAEGAVHTAPDAGGPGSDGAAESSDTGGGGAGDADAATAADAPGEAESGPPTCSGGDILCNGACVNPATDPNHCGGCGTTCSSGVCGTSIAADMLASPSGWTFNGTALWDSSGPSARMTVASGAGNLGTVIYAHSVVTDDFTASFQFRMGAGGGGRYDGMGFMIQASGPTAIGSGNGSLGMGGLLGYGVELDVYNNGQCADNSSDHVGIDSLSFCSSSSMPTSLFASADLTGTVDLADAQWHAATVSLTAGAMSVSIDTKAVAQNVALTGFTAGTPYYFGFAGATGGVAPSGGIQTEVKAVSITFPTPRCL